MTLKNEDTPIVAYKGFDKNWTCRGYQYTVGEVHEHKNKTEVCKSGFHACEYPLDVFTYYAPAQSVFAIVEASGDLDRKGDDSKIASSELTVKGEIGIAGLVKDAIEYTVSRTKPSKSKKSNSDDTYGAASATGNYGAASATGEHSVAMSVGLKGKAMASETGAIVLVYRNMDDEIIHIRASKVGENGIKPDTWYTLNSDGDFIEVSE